MSIYQYFSFGQTKVGKKVAIREDRGDAGRDYPQE